jgi:methyltransferase (TIGR00027 family)
VEALHATARWTAAVRAAERSRSDRLVDDPWAELLAGDEGMAWLAGRTPASVVPILIRTRYFDDWLLDDVVGSAIGQVVLLAAGLDTRAFRLPWPDGAIVYEVDRPGVLDAKTAALSRVGATPGVERRLVPGDLGAPFGRALVAAGFDPSQPAAWLAEGVLFYLPVHVIDHVLAEVTRIAAPGSRLGFDLVNHAALSSPYTKAWLDMQASAGAPWVGWMDEPSSTLDSLGWVATVVQPGEPPANHGRWTLPVIPAERSDLPHSWYVTAVRR